MIESSHLIRVLGPLLLILACSSPHKAAAQPVPDSATASIVENADGTLAVQMAAHDTDGIMDSATAVYSDVWTPSSGMPTLALSYTFTGSWLNADAEFLRVLAIHEFRQGTGQLYRAGFQIRGDGGTPSPYGSAGAYDIFDPANETLSFGTMSLPYSCGTDVCEMNAYVDSGSGWVVVKNPDGTITEVPNPAVPFTFEYDPAGLAITESWTVFADARAGLGGVTWIDFASTVDVGYVTSGGSFATERGRSFGAAPIPEPETYSMLLAGLGLLGWHARRRKNKLSS